MLAYAVMLDTFMVAYVHLRQYLKICHWPWLLHFMFSLIIR